MYTLAAKALLDRGWTATGSMGALFGTAGVVSLPVLAMTDASWLATGPGIAMALWLGLVATALAYVLFGVGLTGLAPATVSTLTLAEPLTAGLLGVVVLGETLSGGAVAGLVVLAAGIVLLATGSRGGGAATERAPAGPEAAPTYDGREQARDVGGGGSFIGWTSFSSPDSGSTHHRGSGFRHSSKRPATPCTHSRSPASNRSTPTDRASACAPTSTP